MEADEDGALTIGAAMDRAQEYVEEVVVMGQMSGNLPISQPLTVGGSTVVGTPLTGSALTGGATGAHSASEALSAEDEREVDESSKHFFAINALLVDQSTVELDTTNISSTTDQLEKRDRSYNELHSRSF